MSEEFKEIYTQSHGRPLREMALLALIQRDPRTLPDGMRIEVINTEYKGTGEEPHFHLFPANHVPRKGKANNRDLITRVHITEEPPKGPLDVKAIPGNSPVPREYQEAIFRWSRKRDDKYKINNWDLLNLFWERQAASFRPGQL